MSKDVCFIIKATNDCNLNCSYCYHFKNNKFTDKNFYMTPDVLEKTIKCLLEYNHHNAHFIWHGGEPLLCGLDFFKNVVELQNKYSNGKKIIISNAIQSNGTLLNQEWIDFFNENKFHIGVSIDGYMELHTKNRNIGPNTFNVLIDKIKILNQNNANWGVLTVITPNTLGHAKELLDFFIESGVHNVGFLPAVVLSDGKIDYNNTVSPLDYGNFLTSFFDEWIKCGKIGMSFREYDEYFRYKLGIAHRLCVNSNECDRYYTIAPDGNIYLCDCFSMSNDTFVGHVENSFKNTIKNNKTIETLLKNSVVCPYECKVCAYKKNCNGGCKYYRWLSDNTMNSPHFFCNSFKILYTHIDKIMEKRNEKNFLL